MRQPSIHVTEEAFLKILDELDIEDFPIRDFFTLARRVSVNTRTVLVTNNKDTKRVNSILLANKGDASMVADIVYATRVKLHHRGVRKINENSNKRDWSMCKDLANICNQFCKDFNFEDARSGFITYITIGFKRMGKDHHNVLTRLIAMAENIYAYYENEQLIREDSNPKLTIRIFEYYNSKVADATGIYDKSDLRENPENYAHFSNINSLCESKGWDYKDFIDAQFDGLAWCNGLPEPYNMYGPKAIERYKKWVYKYGSTNSNNQPKEIGNLWDKINNNG